MIEFIKIDPIEELLKALAIVHGRDYALAARRIVDAINGAGI